MRRRVVLSGYTNGATDYRNGSVFLKCRACRSFANISANTLTLRIPYARFGKPSNISGMRVTSFRMDGTVANWANAGRRHQKLRHPVLTGCCRATKSMRAPSS